MFSVPEKYRVSKGQGFYNSTSADGNNGIFFLDGEILVVASDGFGFEHVSVSLQGRCPSWKEMCYVKDLFWGEEDVVIQYHPAKKDYVNMHPHVLHLWRPIDEIIPLPPVCLV
jgi:hypothetical protein